MIEIAVQPQAFPPLPHSHTMGSIDGLGGKFNSLENQAFGGEGRSYAPMCRFVYTGTFSIANSTDTFAGGGFSSTHDNASMWYGPGTAGGGGDTTKARVRIPVSGFYDCTWQWYVDGVGTSVTSASILVNGTSVTSNAMASGQGASNSWSKPQAHDVLYLAAGDVLYFVMWQGSGAARTVYGTWWAGRTSGCIRWIGR